ncbi:glycosyltransferase [Algisphaera agarilytica]|uniref:Glycosyltransferase involved in cell wall biosynthesis n=1 Tax=Algisphaera agarilytica TaxID=1385975 RepID=A0A7X0LLM3_9BACT|nr:glycosyltransferase family 2 protein [Algisphaera agarilytica]MBB6430786.1 glycosyltransferase involved in cell wall biosynthesis [Algisphaera agarilytica]
MAQTQTDEGASITTQEAPEIAVIIPHFNDWGRLELCLDALAAQTLPADCFEVVVVDNGSSDWKPEIVERFPFARIIKETKVGSYAARNAGINATTSKLLAFTDSDCIPDPSWLEHGIKFLLDNPALGYLGGRIDLFPKEPESPRGVELFDMIFGLNQKSNIEVFDFAATANMITRRQEMDRHGMFDDQLKSGGDKEWGNRLNEADRTFSFVDDVLVLHPARFTLEDLLRQARRHAGGRMDTRISQGRKYRPFTFHFWKTVARTLLPPFYMFGRAYRSPVWRTHGWLALLKVFVVATFVHYNRFWGMIRSRWGAESERQ